jgi:protein-tyrosine-phosphatase
MQFDERFLQEMGLSAMPEDQKQKFLAYIQEELEIRIGERISKGLTETQLNEFDMITDPREAAKWLEKNRPDYREIVNRTIEEMKTEIRANRARLVGA